MLLEKQSSILLLVILYTSCLSVHGQLFPVRNWFLSLLSKNRCSSSCPFAKSNIADFKDDSCFNDPDQLKNTWAFGKSAETETLLVTLTNGGYESTTGSPIDFEIWSGTQVDSTTGDFAWDIAKTSLGTELLSTSEYIKRKAEGQSDYTQIPVGQGGPAFTSGNSFVFVDNNTKIFYGARDGLYLSQDDGVNWVRTPTECQNSTTWCDKGVDILLKLPDASLVVFFGTEDGNGGFPRRLVNSTDPFLESSWQELPDYQGGDACSVLTCTVQDAAFLDNYLYVNFIGNPGLARLNIEPNLAGNNSNDNSWESLPIEDPSVDSFVNVEAIHVFEGVLYASVSSDDGSFSTTDGIYKTSTGTAWEKLSIEGCCSDCIPMPYQAMDDTSFLDGDGNIVKGIVFGTVLGPWFYRVD